MGGGDGDGRIPRKPEAVLQFQGSVPGDGEGRLKPVFQDAIPGGKPPGNRLPGKAVEDRNGFYGEFHRFHRFFNGTGEEQGGE
jgi:hypothetical protein